MVLTDLLYGVHLVAVKGPTGVDITSLQLDSRAVTTGTLFLALKGATADGHDFITRAITAGATAVLCENLPTDLEESITYIQVADSALAAGKISSNYYENPSAGLKLVGVTGTNGKTTVATLLFKLFSAAGYTCGMLSTVQNQIGDEIIPATHTTPDPISLNALLRRMKNAGCTHVFMECSSHAIHQQRLAGLVFTGAIFTNISHDHLDYHKNFDAYIKAKKSWFDSLPSSAFAISNADDKRGTVMLQNTKAKKYYYSLHKMAEFRGKILENSIEGLHFVMNDYEAHFRLIGAFNAYNLLAVFAAATCLGLEKFETIRLMSGLQSAEGRFDFVMSESSNVVGIVDYAHTPDALLNVLVTIKNLKHGPQKLITVIGCGGNRDKSKRPVMGEVACEHSDKVIFTSDNPRNEIPGDIIKDMEAGVKITARKKYLSIPDRKEAIKTAVSLSQAQDIVLVAGKGHEKYQEIMGQKFDFDDKKILNEMFRLLEK
ncbi:MAG: UDP-N-acetylmuramoyl-L-alanyl-D-glutamate--2,6-diaminopimelate ligase [Ferruginibacter sp.]